jgi:outer membrane lipoprotein-sorting protein
MPSPLVTARANRLAAVAMVIGVTLVAPALSALAEPVLRPADLIEAMRAREGRIKDFRASMKTTVPIRNDAVLYDAQWGYRDGKEYLEGVEWLNVTLPDPAAVTRHNVKYAYDGEKVLIFRDSYAILSSWDRSSSTFRGTATVGSLWGLALRREINGLPGEQLREAFIKGKRMAVLQRQKIGDRETVGLEVEEIDTAADSAFDARVWLDPQRDYMPVRIEMFFPARGKNQWKLPFQCVTITTAEKIDGVWVPVVGDVEFFTFRPRQAEREDKPLSRQERLDQLDFVVEHAIEPRRVTVDVDSVKLNKGIADGEFWKELPEGTRVERDNGPAPERAILAAPDEAVQDEVEP